MAKSHDDYQPQIEATAATPYHSTSFFSGSSPLFGQAVPQACSPLSVSSSPMLMTTPVRDATYTSSSVPTNLHFVLPEGTRVLFPTGQEGVYYEQQTSTSEGPNSDVKVYFRLQPVNTSSDTR